MPYINTIIVGVLAVVALFLILVGPHEYGHFIAAKKFGLKVHEYSLGLGPLVFQKTIWGVPHSIRLVPIGGYVKIDGIEIGGEVNKTSFRGIALWKQAVIIIAGPATNFLFAALIATGTFLSQINSDPGQLLMVEPNSPAASAGLHSGDAIQSINGKHIYYYSDLTAGLRDAQGKTVSLTYRDKKGLIHNSNITPRLDPTTNRWQLGVALQRVFTPTEAITTGLTYPFTLTVTMADGLVKMVTNQIPGGPGGAQGISGPVGIATMAYSASSDGILNWLGLLATLCAAMGFMNLLPIPILDGGRLLLIGIQAIIRRPVTPRIEMEFQRVGLVVILGLFVFASLADLNRILQSLHF